jgi:SpoVK/Ycf46/Vps4 family AAA+-type ATPase
MQLAENFNGADLRNICTEAGMFAIRDERDYTVSVWGQRVVVLLPCVHSGMTGAHAGAVTYTKASIDTCYSTSPV